MLTCSKNKNTYLFHFDVPVPVDATTHPEFQNVFHVLQSTGDCALFTSDKNEITGFEITFDKLSLATKSLLPSTDAETQNNLFATISKNGVAKTLQGLNVNFHQNPFDSAHRYWSFILNQGDFAEYLLNRINWYVAPKSGYVMSCPLHVDIESSSTCNMNCPMCYRDQLKDTGQMDFSLFKIIVDECANNNVFSVRLSWRGETLTHPRIKEMIEYATGKIKNVSFLTNAFFIDSEMADCFIKNRVSYIAVSFDGIGNIYESIRHPAKFDTNYHRLETLQEKKANANTPFPQVRLCTIWPAIKNDPDAYYQTMKDVSDYIVCNPYINFKGSMKIKPGFICQYPWERIVIGFDGSAQCCTGWNAGDIILGNVKDKSIKEMWLSDRMNGIRKVHSQGERMNLSSCASCRHGSEAESDIDIWDIVERKY